MSPQVNALQPTIYIPTGPACPAGAPCRCALAQLSRQAQIRVIT